MVTRESRNAKAIVMNEVRMTLMSPRMNDVDVLCSIIHNG